MRLWAAALVALALAGPAAAQPAPAAPPNQTESMARRAAARVEDHIADLRKRLAITPAQQGQWVAFAAILRQNAQEVQQTHRAQDSARPLSAVEDLRAHAASVRQHADAVARLVDPFAALYALFSPEQRAAADRIFADFERRARPAPRF